MPSRHLYLYFRRLGSTLEGGALVQDSSSLVPIPIKLVVLAHHICGLLCDESVKLPLCWPFYAVAPGIEDL